MIGSNEVIPCQGRGSMVNLKRSETRFIDELFDMQSGYVLDFSNRTFAEFFEDEFAIDIYQQKYRGRGTSKANHLRAFIEAEDGYTVGKVLPEPWAYRSGTRGAPPASVEAKFFDLVGRIEAGFAPPVLAALSGTACVLISTPCRAIWTARWAMRRKTRKTP
jgi:hypothetical protein